MSIAEFGPLVVETDVDLAVVSTIKLWMPTYLSRVEVERSLGNGFLSRPKPDAFANTLDDDEFTDHPLPAIIVTTASTVARPEKDGNGMHFAAWNVVVSAICRGRTAPESRAMASLYGGCVRRIMLQQQDLGEFAGEVDWTSSNVAPVATTGQGRYLAAGINTFSIYVDEVVQSGTGPLVTDEDTPYPPADPSDPNTPYDPLAIVTSIPTIEVIPKQGN